MNDYLLIYRYTKNIGRLSKNENKLKERRKNCKQTELND